MPALAAAGNVVIIPPEPDTGCCDDGLRTQGRESHGGQDGAGGARGALRRHVSDCHLDPPAPLLAVLAMCVGDRHLDPPAPCTWPWQHQSHHAQHRGVPCLTSPALLKGPKNHTARVHPAVLLWSPTPRAPG